MGAEELHELVLRPVGVLVLVDHEVFVTTVVPLSDLRVGLEEADGFEEQIVEVEGVGLGEFLAVDLKDVGDLFFERIGAREEVLLRVNHVVLGPGDAAEGDARLELFVVDGEAAQCLLDDGLLIAFVVNGEGAGEADVVDTEGFDVAAEDADAEGVEGGEGGAGERGVAKDFSTRSAISLAALLVKVTARMASGETPRSWMR